MKIKFKITVTAPAAQVGTKGETKEVDDRAANILINGGYAERADIVAKKVARKGGKARLSAAYTDRDLKAIAKKKVVKKKAVAKKVVKKKVIKKTK